MKSFSLAVAMSTLLVIAPTACTTGRSADRAHAEEAVAKVQEQIKPLVESLFLKTKALEADYLDLRAVANVHAFLPDDLQLSHIQKAALYIQLALQKASSQWELLSIMEDIKPTAVQDYYTLRHKGLRKALDETGYDISFVKLYQTFITNADAQKHITNALGVIEEIDKIYVQLIEAVAPLVRKGLPTEV